MEGTYGLCCMALHCLIQSVSLCLIFYLTVSFSVSLSHSFCLTVSFSVSLSHFLSHCLTVSFSVSLSHCHFFFFVLPTRTYQTMTQILSTIGSLFADMTALVTNLIRTLFHTILQFIKVTFNVSEATIQKIIHVVTSFLEFLAHNKTVLLFLLVGVVVYRHFTTNKKVKRVLHKKKA
jgi:hypothetical protein